MSDKIRELDDSNFEQRVLSSAQPVLVDFWASWCAPCRMLTPTLEKIADDFASSAQVVKVNVDESQNIAQQYGIKAIPTLILFKDGKEQERLVGTATQDTISNLLARYTQPTNITA